MKIKSLHLTTHPLSGEADSLYEVVEEVEVVVHVVVE
jgi:hypothetical protein